MPETFEQRPSRLAEIKARRYDWWNQGAPDISDAKQASAEAFADRDWLVARLEECAAALRLEHGCSGIGGEHHAYFCTGCQALAKLEALHE